MSITSDYNNLKTAVESTNIALHYCSQFKKLYGKIKALDAEIEEVSKKQSFGNIPADLKRALNQSWQETKNCIRNFEQNSDVLELITMD